MFFKTPLSTIEVKVPDIGDFKDVPVIEVFVKPGDAVEAEDSLVTLESDKATMDVPAPAAGTVKDLRIKVGDKVSEAGVLPTHEADGATAAKPTPTPAPQPNSAGEAGKGPASSQPDRGKPSDVAQNRPVESRAPTPASGGGSVTTVKVPDIGDFKDVPVIEIFVKPGDSVKPEDALVTLESDKATMDVPAPSAGVVKELKVKVGDKVSEGTPILLLDGAAARAQQAPGPVAKTSVSPPPAPTQAPAGIAEVRVPDIGDFKDVPVIEIMVKAGDTVKAEDPLITLESDKATMDVPAPLGGTVQKLAVKVGDKVSEGTVILTLATGTSTGDPAAIEAVTAAAAPPTPPAAQPASRPAAATTAGIDEAAFALAYAGPGVRKHARELGIDLGKVTGTGNKGRILKQDVNAFAQGAPPAAKAPAA